MGDKSPKSKNRIKLQKAQAQAQAKDKKQRRQDGFAHRDDQDAGKKKAS